MSTAARSVLSSAQGGRYVGVLTLAANTGAVARSQRHSVPRFFAGNEWRAVRNVADAHRGKIARVILEASVAAQNATEDMAKAFETHILSFVEASWMPAVGVYERTLRELLPSEILATLVGAAIAESKTLQSPKVVALAAYVEYRENKVLGGQFNQVNPLASLWARDYSGRQIVQISEETRAAIRSVVHQAFEMGLAPVESARLIRPLIGLDTNRVNAVMNLRARIQDPANYGKKIFAGKTAIRVPSGGMPAALVQKRVEQYADRLLKQRALVIARTETIDSSNEGQRQLWAQYQREGLLNRPQPRRWITTPDDRLCPRCAALSGDVSPDIDKPYEKSGLMGPTAHPLCRCAQGLLMARAKPTKVRPVAPAPILAPPAPSPKPAVPSPKSFSEIETLLTGPVQKADTLGGGATSTFEVQLQNGARGVYKPSSGEGTLARDYDITPGLMPQREAGAWEVAKAMGMDDLVAPTIVRDMTIQVGGKTVSEVGSYQAWQQGQVARRFGGAAKFGASQEDKARAAFFDYVIGNLDRHPGNWMLDNGKMRLIDHGLSFPEVNGSWGHKFLIDEARFSKMEFSTFRDTTLGQREEIKAAMKKSGLTAQIPAMEERLDRLTDMKSWVDLYGVTN